MPPISRSLLLQALTLALLHVAAPAAPQWIWSSKNAGANDTVWVRSAIDLKDTKGVRVQASCDNAFEIWINGEFAGRGTEWADPPRVSAGNFLKPGRNVIAIKGVNRGSMAGLVARVVRVDTDGKNPQMIAESGEEWKLTGNDPGAGWEKESFNDSTWPKAVVVAKLGDPPWGHVFSGGGGGGGGGGGAALAAEALQLLPGFKAELLYTVPKSEEGSWVSLCSDDKGRLIAGDQEGSLYRITLKGGEAPAVEELKTKVKQAQGLLYANKSLYVSRNGGVSGLYRLRDTDGDDQFDEEVLLRKIDGGGEHGPHGVILTADGKGLLITGGNHTKMPNPEKSLVPKFWGEDFIIPRMWDANGHAANIYAPGGWICRTDFDGKEWTLVSAGYRNEYDIALSQHGQIFTYDSDMEWDIGSPWYRPTRVAEAMPGSEFGWRSGASNAPDFADSLPATMNLGPGSPTGVCFGTGAKFPAKYQHGLYVADWTYGTMYVLHLKPQGAGWVAEKEEFVSGKPLPLTDMIIHPQDGAMYFLIGGRKTQSALYRITAPGAGNVAPAPPPALTKEMQQRQTLEKLLGPSEGDVVAAAWMFMGSADRWLRYAARAALEHQPVALWKDKALAETAPEASINALLALARAGGDTYERNAAGELRQAAQGTDGAKRAPAAEQIALRDEILKSAARLNWSSLSESQQLGVLRLHTVLFARTGKPDATGCAAIRKQFEPHYPARTDELNRSLCELLVFLDSPQVVSKTVQLLTTAKSDSNEIGEAKVIARNDGYAKDVVAAQTSRPNRQQIAYGYALRAAAHGWSPELRRQYFRWFNTARKFEGGHSLRGFIENIRKDALKLVPAEFKKELEDLSEELNAPTLADLPKPKGPGRPWSIDDVLALTKDGLKARSYENGRRTYQAALCSSCHRFGTEFGGVGPDVTGSGNRYTLRDLLENIVDPSKVISDQYESTLLEKVDGSSIVGRVIKEEGDKISVAENPLLPAQLSVLNQSDVKTRTKYPVSAMPPALMNSLNKDEVLDLIAFLLSGGNKEDKVFKP